MERDSTASASTISSGSASFGPIQGRRTLRLPTITHERHYMTFKNGMRPVHPGEVLREEYLKPLDLSANALAKALRLSPSRIGDIVLERRGVTADTAVRLARYFGGTAQFWLNLQSIYDLRTAERSAETKRALREIEPLEHSAACANVSKGSATIDEESRGRPGARGPG